MFHFIDEYDILPKANLGKKINDLDLRDSHNIPITVCYNEIDIEHTAYSFAQDFRSEEIKQYFERMKTFSAMTINEIIDEGNHNWHFYPTKIQGNIKRILESINPNIIKANPMIYHFALDINNTNTADRTTESRNPRIYFMVGYKGMIHPLFFDPYHEINP